MQYRALKLKTYHYLKVLVAQILETFKTSQTQNKVKYTVICFS